MTSNENERTMQRKPTHQNRMAPHSRGVGIVAAFFGIAAAACGPTDDGTKEDSEPTATVLQPDSSDSLSVSENPCWPAIGQSTCAPTISWTELDGATQTYQLVMQGDNSAWRLVTCIPAGNPTRSTVTNWIQLGHTYRFSLRKKGGGSCTTIDPTFTEVASTSVEARSASITASSERVLTATTGSTTLTWRATQNYGQAVGIWLLTNAGYNLVACSGVNADTSVNGSVNIPWITPGTNTASP